MTRIERQIELTNFEIGVVVQLDIMSPRDRKMARLADAHEALRAGLNERARIPAAERFHCAIERASLVISSPAAEKAVRMDDFLSYLLDQFHGAPEPYEIARMTTERTHGEEEATDRSFPLLILYELLSSRRLRLDLSLCPNWPPFVERHGSAMMAA